MEKADIYIQNHISMLTSDLREKANRNLIVSQFQKAGCLRADRNPWVSPFDTLHVKRIRVANASHEFGTYNHQSGICKWKNRYWYVFSNSSVDEEFPGMRTMITSSSDLLSWSAPIVLADGDISDDMWRQTAGITGYGDSIIAFVQTKKGHHLTYKPGMSVNDETKNFYKVDLFVSKDGIKWDDYTIASDCYWFEAPRITQDGLLLCAGSMLGHPIVFLWPGNNPLEKPNIIKLPYDPSRGLDSGRFPYGEASWYQTDDGTIFLFHRNETDEMRLRVALSSDGGFTWTEPMLSDIPDSMSRVSAGRLIDGRFYLVNNAIADLLNRKQLMISISDDGYKFDRQYFLLREPTKISYAGALKAHGYQYPCTLPEDDRLIITYSVNKEHMELLILNTDQII